MGKEEKSDLDRLTEGQEGREILIVATWLRKRFHQSFTDTKLIMGRELNRLTESKA